MKRLYLWLYGFYYFIIMPKIMIFLANVLAKGHEYYYSEIKELDDEISKDSRWISDKKNFNKIMFNLKALEKVIKGERAITKILKRNEIRLEWILQEIKAE